MFLHGLNKLSDSVPHGRSFYILPVLKEAKAKASATTGWKRWKTIGY